MTGVAFDIFFELAQFELSADAQLALIKICSDGVLKTDQVKSWLTWFNVIPCMQQGIF
jgi:hypothetical protein